MTNQADSISRVVFGDRLGGGYFGEVFKGTQSPHGPVAVKVIDFDRMEKFLKISDWSTLHEHLQREAEALRKAESSHIVRVHGVGVTPDKKAMHIVTELCDGSLQSLCENGPMSTHRARQSVKDVLHGLEALHVRGMIHRDLKPGNLLFVGSQTKLADFGLVTNDLVLGYASGAGYTEHLAPEVFTKGATSTRTDVWAMGLTIFRLVNGEPWYLSEKFRLGLLYRDGTTNLSAVESAIRNGGFASKLRWMPHLPEALRRLVRRAMNDDSDKRFSDGGEMLTHFTRSVASVDQPDWTCEYKADLVRWTMTNDKGRVTVAEWDRSDPDIHRIDARSEPTTPGGRTRTLIPKTALKPAEAIRQLEDFFAGKLRT